MSEWKEYKLEDVADLITGFPFPGENYEMLGKLKVVRGENVTTGNLRWDSEKYWNHSLENLEKYFLNEDDIVIGMDGSKVGHNRAIIRANELPLILAQRVARLRAKRKFNQKFIWYQIYNKRFIAYIEAIQTGTSIPHISPSQIKNFEILAPEYEEQRTIGELLQSLDDKIDLLHRQINTLEKLAETLFRQSFMEAADETFEHKQLKDILEFVVDNRGRTAPESNNGVPLIATNCVKNNNIFPIYEKVRYVSQEIYDTWFRAHPKPGDLIFVNKGTPGCVNLVPNPIDFCIAQDMIALRVNKEIISNYFLFIYFRCKEIQSKIINSSVGTTIPHLKKADLMKFIIPCPNRFLLEKFNHSVEPFFQKMNNNIRQIRILTQLRDTLLPKLMSGEVRTTIDIVKDNLFNQTILVR